MVGCCVRVLLFTSIDRLVCNSQIPSLWSPKNMKLYKVPPLERCIYIQREPSIFFSIYIYLHLSLYILLYLDRKVRSSNSPSLWSQKNMKLYKVPPLERCIYIYREPAIFFSIYIYAPLSIYTFMYGQKRTPLQQPVALVPEEYEALQGPATRKVTIYKESQLYSSLSISMHLSLYTHLCMDRNVRHSKVPSLQSQKNIQRAIYTLLYLCLSTPLYLF